MCIRDSYDCAGNLVCNNVKCEPPPPPYVDGSLCGDNGDCGPNNNGLYCDAGTCRPVKQVGEDCTLNACNTYEYERCDVDGTGKCLAPSIGGEGTPCDMFQGKACAPGLLCSAPDFGDGVCFRPRGDGENCSATDPLLGCGFGLRCLLFTCTAADEPVCLNP